MTRAKEIVEIALKMKKKYSTTDPFEVARNLDIHIDFTSFNKKAIKAYTIRTDENRNSPTLICINSEFDKRSQLIFCAHELGHAILHKNACNHFDGDSLSNLNEYEANLFAVAFLFDPNSFRMDITKMDNCILRTVLDYNVNA